MRIWYCMQVWAKNENARCNSGGFEGSFLGSGKFAKTCVQRIPVCHFFKKIRANLRKGLLFCAPWCIIDGEKKEGCL